MHATPFAGTPPEEVGMKKRKRLWGSIGLVILLSAALYITCADEDPPGYRPCYRGAHYLHKDRIEFDDGDTIVYGKIYVRILGIDTPETEHPEVGIYENQPYGPEASDSAEALISRARVAEYLFAGKDYYGRTLGHIFVDGELLGVKLIEMGLAYETVSHYGDNGFPDLAQRILDASLTAPKPAFQKPYLWRKKHQKKR
jgi:hypothetical protein